MHIERNTVVQLHVQVSDVHGELIDPGTEPLEYLHGGYGDFLPSIETQLEGREAGYEAEFHLEPEDAFGEYDAALLRVVPLEDLPAGIEPGMQFEGMPGIDAEDNEDAHRIFTVTDIDPKGVVLDGNHPLAGLALNMAVQVVAVRPADEEEIEAGHALSASPGLVPVLRDLPLH